MKSGQRVSNKVRCPFYKCEERQVIYCEGVEDGTALHLAFNIPLKLKEYKKQKCESCYEKCVIAQMLEKKYQ